MYEIRPIEGLEIGIMGNNGAWALAKDDSNLIIAGGPVGGKKEVKVDYYSDNEGLVHIGVQSERRAFLECIKTRKQPYANLSTAREACVISLADEKSIKQGRAILISDFYNPEVETIFQELGYIRQPKTPPIFSLEKNILKPKLKRELKVKEGVLKRELEKVKEEIRNL